MTILTKPLPELDYTLLDKLMDRTKTQVFTKKNGAFLGPLMCSLNFSWTEDIETACTNGVTLWWNPHFFLDMDPSTRETILLHELWHSALLHMLRRGNRNPRVWNYAADIVINNMLDHQGYKFGKFKPWMDHKYDGLGTEVVYDMLMDEFGHHNPDDLKSLFDQLFGPQWTNPITGLGDEGDIIEPEDGEEHTILGNIVTATHTAKMSGGDVPGETEVSLKRFLSPKLPWEKILHNFFNELSSQDYSWSRPNRRYQDIYLPSLQDDSQGLDHIIYYLDVSGSISDGDIIRFHSEFKYVKEFFQPLKMTMVQFDTRIQKEDVFLKEDPFEETHVIGRGGTSFVCVRDHIIKHKPTGVIIFSDMCCAPMEPLPVNLNVPLIWVALNNSGSTVSHGTIIHLNE